MTTHVSKAGLHGRREKRLAAASSHTGFARRGRPTAAREEGAGGGGGGGGVRSPEPPHWRATRHAGGGSLYLPSTKTLQLDRSSGIDNRIPAQNCLPINISESPLIRPFKKMESHE